MRSACHTIKIMANINNQWLLWKWSVSGSRF